MTLIQLHIVATQVARSHYHYELWYGYSLN